MEPLQQQQQQQQQQKQHKQQQQKQQQQQQQQVSLTPSVTPIHRVLRVVNVIGAGPRCARHASAVLLLIIIHCTAIAPQLPRAAHTLAAGGATHQVGRPCGRRDSALAPESV